MNFQSGPYSFKQSLSTLGYNEMQKDHTDIVRPSEITWASEPVLAAVSAAAASHQQRVVIFSCTLGMGLEQHFCILIPYLKKLLNYLSPAWFLF